MEVEKFGLIEDFINDIPNYYNVREYRKYLEDL